MIELYENEIPNIVKLNTMKNLFFLLITAILLPLAVTAGKGSDKTGRPVRITSLCFEGIEFRKILKIIDEEGAIGTDIIVLPETWRGDKYIETIKGETITALSELARKHRTYIISPIELKEGKHHYNTAVLIGRNGDIIGCYNKIYPYWGEFDLVPPVEPGIKTPPVFETDFGKIGMAICFDSNFPEVWQVLKDKGAEIVFWSSAYSAGSQLQAYALLHHYYIVTSTWSKDCQVYDITGQRIIDNSADSITVTRLVVDLDRGIYHENFNMDKLNKLLQTHGNEIEEEIHMPREQWFVLKAKKPGISARSLAKEFNLEELTDYQLRSRQEIDKRRGFSFAKSLNNNK